MQLSDCLPVCSKQQGQFMKGPHARLQSCYLVGCTGTGGPETMTKRRRSMDSTIREQS